MAALGRRELLRMAGPAIALPVVANVTVAQAKEQRLVTREEIMEAFRFFDRMELQATDLNLRYQILIDMLFETNPDTLRAKLQQLIDNRKDRMVLVDPDSGQFAPFDPSMYERLTKANADMEQIGRERVDAALAPAREQLKQASDPVFGGWAGSGLLPKPKLRTRIAAWLIGWRA